MKNLTKLVITLTAVMFAASAFAQDAAHLKLTTVVHKEEVVTADNGEEKKELVAATTVVPGDSVIYTITFENVSPESAENVTITNPVPANLTYEVGSAFGPGAVIEFSVDGGAVYGAANSLTITENGETRNARPEDYTHIRWVMQSDLAAGAQGVARFRARLN
jgi:uncharacterized repeat protein (TIGR01451 family)